MPTLPSHLNATFGKPFGMLMMCAGALFCCCTGSTGASPVPFRLHAPAVAPMPTTTTAASVTAPRTDALCMAFPSVSDPERDERRPDHPGRRLPPADVDQHLVALAQP